jgi:hypothetical protein
VLRVSPSKFANLEFAQYKYSNDPESKVIDIVGLYLHPPENALVLSVDEKSQIQAFVATQAGAGGKAYP